MNKKKRQIRANKMAKQVKAPATQQIQSKPEFSPQMPQGGRRTHYTKMSLDLHMYAMACATPCPHMQ